MHFSIDARNTQQIPSDLSKNQKLSRQFEVFA